MQKKKKKKNKTKLRTSQISLANQVEDKPMQIRKKDNDRVTKL